MILITAKNNGSNRPRSRYRFAVYFLIFLNFLLGPRVEEFLNRFVSVEYKTRKEIRGGRQGGGGGLEEEEEEEKEAEEEEDTGDGIGGEREAGGWR